MMIVNDEKAKAWYELNGISNDDWDSFDRRVKNLLRLEATLYRYDEITQMLETGIPESAVIVKIKPADINIDEDKIKKIDDSDYRDISTYIIQNANRTIKRIYGSSDMTVWCVDYDDEFIKLEIEPNI